MAQVAAEELGISLEDIRVVSGDTELTPIDLGNFLSGGALVTGNAVKMAAAEAKKQLFEAASELIDAHPTELVAKDRRIYIDGRPERGISFAEAARASILEQDGNPVIGRGYFKPLPDTNRYPSLAKAKGHFTPAYGYAAHVAEVEVDTLTGEVEVVKLTAYHDSGFPLNRLIVEGQIDGNVSMGLGQALKEEVLLREGQILNPSLLSYLVPTSLETPQMQRGHVVTNEPKGPFGAKEVGEGAIAGVLAAVANAVNDAAGARIKSLPISPDKVLRAMQKEHS
jgi:CO/xanthine dehydrogenase Mo-binding subunit